MAECIGTALLLAAVVGSGIMGERLAGGNVALATGAALVALILAFGAISGAHFNPLVTLAAVAGRTLGWREAPLLLGGTTVGAFAGVAAAHFMFGEPPLSAAQQARAGGAQAAAVPYAVGAYIAAAYWFTASTSFTNPAVTLTRAASDSFAASDRRTFRASCSANCWARARPSCSGGGSPWQGPRLQPMKQPRDFTEPSC